MSMRSSLVLIFALAVPAWLTAQDPEPMTAAAREVAAARAAWVTAFNQGDTIALLRSHTDDATFINASGRLLAAGDLRAFYRSAVNTFGDLSVEIVRLDVEGDVALEVSRYRDTFRPGAGMSLPHGGTQLIVWHRVEGVWLQAAVMVNSSFSRLVVPPGGS
jgi:ketosteroid isomerase-like protein